MDDRTVLTISCVECKQPQAIKVRPHDLQRWRDGEGHVQDIFPYLTASEREMFMSRICGVCWDRMFKPDEGEWETMEIDLDDETAPNKESD